MIDRILDQLHGIRADGAGWSARCPAHGDNQNSLSVGRGEKAWLLYCHAGCDFREIIEQLGLKPQQLFYDYDPNSNTGLDTYSGLQKLIQATYGWKKERRFDEVAWDMCRDSPGERRGLTEATVLYHPEAGLPFLAAMEYWVILRDGWLWSWFGESFLLVGHRKMSWREFTGWIRERLWEEWSTT